MRLRRARDTYGNVGPLFSMYSRFDGGYDDVRMVLAQGNVQGLVDYGSATTGFVLGNDVGLAPWEQFRGITNDENDGVRLFNVGLSLYDDNANLAIFIDDQTGIDFLLGDTPESVRSALTWYESIDDPSSKIASIATSRPFTYNANGDPVYVSSGAVIVYDADAHVFLGGQITNYGGLSVQTGSAYVRGSVTIGTSELGFEPTHFDFTGKGNVIQFGNSAEQDVTLGTAGSYKTSATQYKLDLLNDDNESTGEAIRLIEAVWPHYTDPDFGFLVDTPYARSDVKWSLPALSVSERLELDDAQLGSDWKPLPLAIGWRNYGSSWQDAEYKLIGDLVLLRGLITKSNYVFPRHNLSVSRSGSIRNGNVSTEPTSKQ